MGNFKNFNTVDVETIFAYFSLCHVFNVLKPIFNLRQVDIAPAERGEWSRKLRAGTSVSPYSNSGAALHKTADPYHSC